MVAKKLLVDDIITIIACVKQICLLGVSFEQKNFFFSNIQTQFGETICFLEKLSVSIFKFCALGNLLFFYEMLIGPQTTFLEFIVFFCNPIGQL